MSNVESDIVKELINATAARKGGSLKQQNIADFFQSQGRKVIKKYFTRGR
jgi:hypothetical protein